jgi:hypothetical protein
VIGAAQPFWGRCKFWWHVACQAQPWSDSQLLACANKKKHVALATAPAEIAQYGVHCTAHCTAPSNHAHVPIPFAPHHVVNNLC